MIQLKPPKIDKNKQLFYQELRNEFIIEELGELNVSKMALFQICEHNTFSISDQTEIAFLNIDCIFRCNPCRKIYKFKIQT